MNKTMDELRGLWPVFEVWLLILLTRFATYSLLRLVELTIRLSRRYALHVSLEKRNERPAEGEQADG